MQPVISPLSAAASAAAAAAAATDCPRAAPSPRALCNLCLLPSSNDHCCFLESCTRPPALSLPHHSSSSILVLPLPPPLPYLAVPRPASLVSLSRSDAKLSELLLTTDIELTIFLYGFDRSL